MQDEEYHELLKQQQKDRGKISKLQTNVEKSRDLLLLEGVRRAFTAEAGLTEFMYAVRNRYSYIELEVGGQKFSWCSMFDDGLRYDGTDDEDEVEAEMKKADAVLDVLVGAGWDSVDGDLVPSVNDCYAEERDDDDEDRYVEYFYRSSLKNLSDRKLFA